MTSSARTIRRVITGAAVTGLVALVTACGPSSGTSAGSATSGAATASATPTAAAPAASTPAAATSAAATAAPAAAGSNGCPTRSLSAKIGVSQGTAGSTYTVIDFKNIGTATCTLYGYPGVSFAGGTPVKQIGLAATESNTAARKLVTLTPGTVVNALLRIVEAGNFPASTCGMVTSTYLKIYPPNQTTPIYVGFKSSTCSKKVQILTIGVVQPGSGSAG